MKILFVTPVVPTETDGRRPYNFIKYLSSRHEVHLVALKPPEQNPGDIRRLQEMGVRSETIDVQPFRSSVNCLLGLALGKPLRVSWCRSDEVRVAIERTLARSDFDLLHFDRMRMGQYVKQIDIPAILDFTDSLMLYLKRSHSQRTKISERLIDRWETATIPRFERWLLKRVHAAMVCSSIDADKYRDYHPGYTIDVIENAVDLDQFSPRSLDPGHSPRCILTGTLFYFANIDSVLFYRNDILPAIRERFPDMESRIIGTRPTRAMQKLDGRDGITLLADVPRMEDYLDRDDIYLCPLRVAAGVRNKLLEAMACGMPIITTAIGAEGLDLQDGKEALFAETPEAFTECIQHLLESPGLRQSLGEAARNYVIERHSLDQIGNKLEAIYERILS